MENIAKAIIGVMKDIKNIEKNSNVGTGNASYKGVSDKDVKQKVGEAMQKHGLCILPIEVKPKTQIDRWEENTNFGVKTKQSVFTEVETKYMLLHESGESIEIAGYGHGVDTQDKGAGKATTYALKYALLYAFMIPTGDIDDTDNTHSESIATPQKGIKKNTPEQTTPKPRLTEGKINKIIERSSNGEKITLKQLQELFTITEEQKDILFQNNIL